MKEKNKRILFNNLLSACAIGASVWWYAVIIASVSTRQRETVAAGLNAPVFVKPIAYTLPLTYGGDMPHGAIHGGNILSIPIDLVILVAFCVGLFMVSRRNNRRCWIA